MIKATGSRLQVCTCHSGRGQIVAAARHRLGSFSRLTVARSMATSVHTQADPEHAVKQLYDYDAIVAQAPDPEAVEWVFGYGSILFKQGFEAGHSIAGYIEGWRRVFYQHSTDHRGTPDAPGRTVTLIPEAGTRTWGIAYQLPADLETRRLALQELEWREKQYDVKVFTPIYGADGTTLVQRALTYVGSDDPSKNVNWGGYADTPALAAQIAVATGPSGPNHEYLYKLADGLRALGVEDAHVFDLEAAVRDLRGDAPPATPPAPPAPPPQPGA